MLDWAHHFIDALGLIVRGTIDAWHYAGVALLMAIESANIPLPSEVILPYAGYLVQQGHLTFWGASFAGAIGCVLGSVPSYALGYYGGRPFLARYGKWLLLTQHDLETSEKWVARYGDWAFLLCRMLPVIRTFISLPAGILKARFWPFVGLTFLGSLIWSIALVEVGVKMGEHIEALKAVWHKFDAVIILAVLALGVLYVYKHLKHFRTAPGVPDVCND